MIFTVLEKSLGRGLQVVVAVLQPFLAPLPTVLEPALPNALLLADLLDQQPLVLPEGQEVLVLPHLPQLVVAEHRGVLLVLPALSQRTQHYLPILLLRCLHLVEQLSDRLRLVGLQLHRLASDLLYLEDRPDLVPLHVPTGLRDFAGVLRGRRWIEGGVEADEPVALAVVGARHWRSGLFREVLLCVGPLFVAGGPLVSLIGFAE